MILKIELIALAMCPAKHSKNPVPAIYAIRLNNGVSGFHDDFAFDNEIGEQIEQFLDLIVHGVGY